jgi:hypothetical protein
MKMNFFFKTATGGLWQGFQEKKKIEKMSRFLNKAVFVGLFKKNPDCLRLFSASRQGQLNGRVIPSRNWAARKSPIASPRSFFPFLKIFYFRD